MRFDWKTTIRCLDPQAPSNALNFLRKSLLILVGADVFNHTIGKNDVEALIGEWQVATISSDAGEIWGHFISRRRVVDIHQGNRRPERKIPPKVIVAPNVQNGCLLSWLEYFEERS